VDQVNAVFNSFKSAGRQELRTTQLLPVLPSEPEPETAGSVDYIYEPDAEGILASIVPQNLVTQVWLLMLESYASEQAARMVAMDSATENAEEMIQDLTLYYNKVRQAAITKEILDIVGGAEALRG
jgi:F-type H+-transporting ATPase subunit gamma